MFPLHQKAQEGLPVWHYGMIFLLLCWSQSVKPISKAFAKLHFVDKEWLFLAHKDYVDRNILCILLIGVAMRMCSSLPSNTAFSTTKLYKSDLTWEWERKCTSWQNTKPFLYFFNCIYIKMIVVITSTLSRRSRIHRNRILEINPQLHYILPYKSQFPVFLIDLLLIDEQNIPIPKTTTTSLTSKLRVSSIVPSFWELP